MVEGELEGTRGREVGTAGAAGALPAATASGHARPGGAPSTLLGALRRPGAWFADRGIASQATILWALSRLFLVAVTLIALATRHQPLSRFFTTWVQWDAGWYLSIAQYGYSNIPSAGFFPLYPLLVHLASYLLPGVPLVVPAMLISSGCALLAAIGLALLASFEFGSARVGVLAAAVLLAYPVAYFLAAPYTEGLFLASTIFALYCARRGYWWRAALCAFVAGMTRATAVVLVLPLLLEYGAQQRWWQPGAWLQGSWRARLHPRVLFYGALVGGAAGFGLLAVAALDWRLFNDPFFYAYAQRTFMQHPQWSLPQTLGVIASHILHPPRSSVSRLLMVLDFGTMAVVLVTVLLNVRRLSLGYLLYMAGLFYFLFASDPQVGTPEVLPATARYLMVSVPFFLVVARWGEGHPRLLTLGIGASCVLQAGFCVLFLHGTLIS